MLLSTCTCIIEAILKSYIGTYLRIMAIIAWYGILNLNVYKL